MMLASVTTTICSDCKQPITEGMRAVDRDNNYYCYDCSATRELNDMLCHFRATLYLTINRTHIKPEDNKFWGWIYPPGHNGRAQYVVDQPTVGNWTGKIKFNVTSVKMGEHNMARHRYDVWFNVTNPDTNEVTNWHGVTYGDNTQLCHCKQRRK